MIEAINSKSTPLPLLKTHTFEQQYTLEIFFIISHLQPLMESGPLENLTTCLG